MSNNILPNQPNPLAQVPLSLSVVIDNVLRRAMQFNPALSKVPQLQEVQAAFAEMASLYNALPLTPSPDPKLVQARQALAQARAVFGQRAESQLYQALAQEEKKLQNRANWSFLGAAFLGPMVLSVTQGLWSHARQRFYEVYLPVAEFLEKQGWPNLKATVLACIKDIENALGINARTMQQSAAAASQDAAILAQAQQYEVQTMNQVNHDRVQSFERSSNAFGAYLRE